MKYVYKPLIGLILALVTVFSTRHLGLCEFLQGAYTMVAYYAVITFPKP